jgi:predicted nucleic acid-binding protein
MILTLDNEYSAVLDACVLAPMPLCDTLLRCAEEPALYRALWSEQTLVEVERTLRKFGFTDKQATRRLTEMKAAFPEASISIPPGLLQAFPDIPDPDDAHVMAAAVQAHAQVIVTSNRKHFPIEQLAPHEIDVQSPDDFLVHQFHLNPDRMLDILDTQASASRQRRTDILNRYKQALPNFYGLFDKEGAY